MTRVALAKWVRFGFSLTRRITLETPERLQKYILHFPKAITTLNLDKEIMNMKISSSFFLFFLAFAVVVPSAFAVGKPDGAGMGRATQGEMRSNRQITPGEGKMRACQARESSIKNRMTHLAQLATTMEVNFDKHAQRVEDYYNNKVVPSGKTVVNYESLVTNIQTQKTAVQTALATAQTDASAFSCTSGTPKEQTTKFREDMQAVKQALKAYRTAIKDLIVAVRSVGAEEGSPKPTE